MSQRFAGTILAVLLAVQGCVSAGRGAPDAGPTAPTAGEGAPTTAPVAPDQAVAPADPQEMQPLPVEVYVPPEPDRMEVVSSPREYRPVDASTSQPEPVRAAPPPVLVRIDEPVPAARDCTVVRTYFATDRNRTASAAPGEMFGNERAEIAYGVADVSIPRTHTIGNIEEPSALRFEFSEDPALHVVLQGAETLAADEFFGRLAARVKASGRGSAFLFVHGYCVTFEEAAKRTAQIAYDLEFEGAPAFYAWPSQGSVDGYRTDEQTVEWARENLRRFLSDFLTRSEATDVYLIAHSMGNRALTRALTSLLAERPELRSRLTEVILAAPDIDAEVFKRDIAPALAASGRPITLYASSADLALTASREVNGAPRAGDTADGVVVVPGIETVDATAVDTSFVGHSYFAENRSVLSDLHAIIRGRQRAHQRFGLRAVESAAGRYWEFRR